MRIVLLEPYYGGSHAAFCDTWINRSCHEVTLVTMPARKWKWRMRGAAIWFATEANEWINLNPDLIVCNDMLAVADLRALLPKTARFIPIACYFHENQLTYPIPDESQRDYQYGMTNLTSALASDAVWFNSRFHMKSFYAAAQALLQKMPDCVPTDAINLARRKSTVLYPPVEFSYSQQVKEPSGVPRILWPHRWEYDKNPEPFFNALIQLAREGVDFRLVLLGEQFRVAPAIFADSWEVLRAHIDHAGFIENRLEYHQTLLNCDVVVSTAIQENFGIAVVEAMMAGCQPLFPNRLAYPELLPQWSFPKCLYDSEEQLLTMLREVLRGERRFSAPERARLCKNISTRFCSTAGVSALDAGAELLVQHHSK